MDESIALGEKKFPTSQFHIDKNSAVRIIVDLLPCVLKQRDEKRGRKGKGKKREHWSIKYDKTIR